MRPFALLLAAILAAPAARAAKGPDQFAVYYTDKLSADHFAPYSLLVLDSVAHPDLAPLRARGQTVLGYLSLCETGGYRPQFHDLKAARLLLGEIPQAPDHYYVDVRRPEWVRHVLEVQIPDLLHRGFTGLMLDTADTATQLEQRNSKTYAGMQQGVVRLVKAIRMHYPQLPVMINRGFAMLPELAPQVNMVLAESIYTTLDKERRYVFQPRAHYDSVVAMLKGLRGKNPALGLYTLDYWSPTDGPGIKEIYAAQRANGLIPYVSTPDLQHLVSYPE